MIRRWSSSGWRWLIATLIATVAVATVAGALAERRAIDALRAQARVDARLRAVLLDSEIARFKLLPLSLADDRDVIAATGGTVAARQALNLKLEALAGVTGAPAIYVVGPDGIAIAASNWRSPRSFVGADYRSRPYFREALARGQGNQYALGTVSRRPGLYLAQRTATLGAIVIKLEFDRIEREWARAGGISLVRNAVGMVVVTSRPDWRFSTTRALPAPDKARFCPDNRAARQALALLPRVRCPADDLFVSAGSTFVAQDAVTSQPGWRLTVLRPIDDAVASARRDAALIAALATIAVAEIAWTLHQRVTAARRRTADLETLVAERTAELRREMDRREETEARAAELREGLLQANRLASLGQITASVAHETAQPVAAIRTYALSSTTLLDRGALDDVRTNLGTIGRLAERIGTVTAQLRGFSSRQSGAIGPVMLAGIIDGTLLILKEQLRGITLDLPAIPPGLAVIGREVQLEQVLVILLQNAAEALSDSTTRRVGISIVEEPAFVRLTVTDSGPGIAPDIAARLFTPFVTSRADGLGLGLVIAHDIMTELGGSLRLRPSETGACFEIGMRRA